MPDDRSRDAHRASGGYPRRTFLARLSGVMTAWPLLRRMPLRRALAATSAPRSQPNTATLVALGDAVLPAELGTRGVATAVAEFERWMTGYRPGAEANHGYGTGKIDRTPADLRPQWRSQLAALESEARRAGGHSFSALTRDRRQALVRSALEGERGDALPNPLLARHIALALLAHFYDSAAATDLCYRAQIGRQQCRPLAAQHEKPVELARRTP